MDDAASASSNDSDILQPQFQVTNLEYFLGPGHHDDHGGGGNISIAEEEAHTQGTANTDDNDVSTNNNPSGDLRVRRGWRRLRQTSHRINQSMNNTTRDGTTNVTGSRRNMLCAALVAVLTVWGPIFLAIIVSFTGYLPDFGKRKVQISCYSLFGTSLLAFLFSARYLAIHNPIKYLKVMFAAITLYVVILGPVLMFVLGGIMLSRAGIKPKVFLLGMSVCGWGLLILISAGVFFKDHDYKWHHVALSDGRNDELRQELFQRGIDGNAFKYKYLPKVHLICFCLVCILIATMGAAIVWRPSLVITLPLGITSTALMCCIGVNND